MAKPWIVATLAAAAGIALPRTGALCDDVMAVRTADGQEGVGIVTFTNERKCMIIVPRHVFCPVQGATCSTVSKDHSIYDEKGQEHSARATLDKTESQLEFLKPLNANVCENAGGFTTAAGRIQDLLRRFPSGFLKVAQQGGRRMNVPVEIVSYGNRDVTVRPALNHRIIKGMSGSPLILGGDGAIVAILNDVCADAQCDAGRDNGTALRIDALGPQIESVLSLAGTAPPPNLLQRSTFVLGRNDEASLDSSEVTVELMEAEAPAEGVIARVKLIMRSYSGKRIDRSAPQLCYLDRVCNFQMLDRRFSVHVKTIGKDEAVVQIEEVP